VSGTRKVEQKTLQLFPIDYPFETLKTRIDSGKLVLDPDFQRQYKWDNERASKFIESCLMRIPLPSCYFSENQDSTHCVIDGVQRLSSIRRFFDNEFPLSGLTTFEELQGKRFSELGNYKSELETTTIRCIVLRKENPTEIITEIFSRLNQGSVELSAQEVRHALFSGSFDTLLTELSQREEIKEFGVPKSIKKMTGKKKESEIKKHKKSRESEEQVLRYFALRGDLSDYQSKLSKYLDQYMEDNRNLPPRQIQCLRDDFNSTLDKCVAVFEKEELFINTTKSRTRQSIVYYDILMHSFRHIPMKDLQGKRDLLVSKFKELCSENDIRDSFKSGSQSKNYILRRRLLWQEKLDEVFK
jgi:uncharacterized protein with ParB-like and HNH nuclease domain